MGALQVVFLALLLSLAASGQAAVFSSSYLKFSLPNKWACQLEDTVWICRPAVASACQKSPQSSPLCRAQMKAAREALIILTAKELGPLDNLEAYLKDLQSPRPLRATGGTSQSQVIHAKSVKIGQQAWVDGLHLSSELPNYYTRYLATVRGQIGVLVTFSAHKKYYTNYSAGFFNAIKTLQVTSSRLDRLKKNEVGPKVLSRPLDLPEDLMANIEISEEAPSGDSTASLLFAIAILLAGVGLFIWLKGLKRPSA